MIKNKNRAEQNQKINGKTKLSNGIMTILYCIIYEFASDEISITAALKRAGENR